MDKTAINDYLRTLFAPEDRVELVAVKDGVARRKEFDVGYLTTPNGYAILEAFEREGWNLYVSVLPLGIQDANLYDRVWIDVDDTSVEFDPALPQASAIVQTSPGRWQAIWLLESFIGTDEGKSLVRRIAQAYGGDTAVHDPRRVLRLPGIPNAKRGVPTFLNEAGRFLTNTAAFNVPDELTADSVTMDALMSTSVNDPKAVLGEWLAGTDEGDRARKAYVTARFLKSCGVTFEDALILVNTGAQRAQPPLSEQEVVHSTSSAYNRE